MQHNSFDQQNYIVESDNQPNTWTANRGQLSRYEHHDRHVQRVQGYRETVQGVKNFVLTILGVAFIILMGLGIWTMRAALPFVGILAIVSAVILLICGVAWVVVSTIRHATRADYVEMGEFGGYYRNAFGRVTPLAPMIAAPTKVNKATAKVEITPAVPSLFDLIEAGEIATGVLNMVMGYDKTQLVKGILQLVVGPWPGTHAVAGKGRSGKTRRVIGEIAQALIAGARVFVCDPHFTKPDSLANALAPLEQYLTIARGESEILAVTHEFLNEMYSRQETEGYEPRPWLVVYDEWSRLMNPNNPKMDDDGRELLKETALRCSTEFAGYLGFCCLIGQVWTNEAAGGTDVRRSLQAVFIHQLSAEYAQFFVRAAKWKNKVEELKRRECLYRDNDNQVLEIITIGVPDDTAQRVAVYLASQGFPTIAAPASAAPGRELPAYHEHPSLREQPGEPHPLELPSPGQLSPAGEIHPEYTYSRLPLEFPRESENVVNSLIELGEPMEPLQPIRENPPVQGETFTTQVKAVEYTREQETAILRAAFQLARESNGRVTRSDIKERLGWNNKAYPIIKAVCDAHDIAKQ